MTLDAIEKAVPDLPREIRAQLLLLILDSLRIDSVPVPPAPTGPSVRDTMIPAELAVELGHSRDWVYRQAKKPGTLVHACRLPGEGRPRFSRKLLQQELARRARGLARRDAS